MTDINSVAQLLITILLHVSSGKEQTGQKEIPNIQSAEKKHTRGLNVESRLVLKETVTQYDVEESGPPEQDPTRLTLQLLKGRDLRKFPFLRSSKSKLLPV